MMSVVGSDPGRWAVGEFAHESTRFPDELPSPRKPRLMQPARRADERRDGATRPGPGSRRPALRESVRPRSIRGGDDGLADPREPSSPRRQACPQRRARSRAPRGLDRGRAPGRHHARNGRVLREGPDLVRSGGAQARRHAPGAGSARTDRRPRLPADPELVGEPDDRLDPVRDPGARPERRPGSRHQEDHQPGHLERDSGGATLSHADDAGLRQLKDAAKMAEPRGNSKSGYALPAILILAFAMGIIGMSFISMAGHETRQSQGELDSQRAFWLAEAGKERAMRWMATRFRPPDTDETIYQGIADAGGGTYSVEVVVDTSTLYSNTKGFMLEAVGNSGTRERRIRQRIRMLSFAQYAYFTDDERTPGGTNIWFIGADQIHGRIHTNGTFRIYGSPTFHGEVTSASDRMIGYPYYHVYGPDGWPIGGNNPQ
ncbi:MAG: DUF4900 domain-containing protein, partial [Candidatus Eisenbacteria bacterium]|nr:DUF4900 domain-containing protein [Candidatus Latescibacterota bacterium]MBD3303397.1 DUF4900 domain-containing protein [Candidatus Eisenbacteria bacterium]